MTLHSATTSGPASTLHFVLEVPPDFYGSGHCSM